jgi:predicted AAA+ superfamily ATPase
MIHREKYLDKIIPNIDNGFVKIITGVRRSGKSVILQQIQAELLTRGVTEDQIVTMNFESFQNHKYLNDLELLHADLMAKIPVGHVYLFFDEVQLVDQWEYLINSLLVDVDADIYVTGSNAALLSGELATLLTGRYYRVEVYPFSFAEYLALKEINLQDKVAIVQAFDKFALDGGMPGVIWQDMDEILIQDQLSDLYDSIMLRDVSQRIGMNNGQLMHMLTLVMLDSITSEVNVSKLVNRLKASGYSITTGRFREYVQYLEQAYLFYRIPEINIRGSQRIRSNDKFYVVDNGLWRSQVGDRKSNIGNRLENIVCLELLRRGYTVRYGKIDGKEVDFVAEKRGERLYIQVTQQLPENSTREVDNLLDIRDTFPKLLLTGVDTGVSDIQSVPVKPVYEWLLETD